MSAYMTVAGQRFEMPLDGLAILAERCTVERLWNLSRSGPGEQAYIFTDADEKETEIIVSASTAFGAPPTPEQAIVQMAEQMNGGDESRRYVGGMYDALFPEHGTDPWNDLDRLHQNNLNRVEELHERVAKQQEDTIKLIEIGEHLPPGWSGDVVDAIAEWLPRYKRQAEDRKTIIDNMQGQINRLSDHRDELQSRVTWLEHMSLEARLIGDGTARAIADPWHGGGGSRMYQFTSTGAIDDNGELLSEIRTCMHIALDEQKYIDLHNLLDLRAYVAHKKPRGMQVGWANKWDDDVTHDEP